MKCRFSFLLIILLFMISCDQNPKTAEVNNNQDSVEIAPTQISFTIGETLIPEAKKDLDTWKEYTEVDDFIIKFYSTSVMEALANAEELATLTQYMKDSIRLDKVDKINVKARLNVLNNEALRLSDMANIPSIKNEEVKEEVGKILELFSAVNSKINTIYSAEILQQNLEVDTELPIRMREDTEKINPRSRPRKRSSTKKN